MDMERIVGFIERTIKNDYTFSSLELSSFGREETTELLSLFLMRVASRDLALREMVSSLEQKVKERTRELEEKNAQLEELSIVDPLTGLHNRRLFDAKLGEYSQLELRLGQTMCCLMADIDHFKALNDSLGHQAGDKALVKVASLVRAATRTTDVCARYGGEEFVALLPNTSLDEGLKLAEKIRQSVNTARTTYGDATIHVTLSIGVAAGCRGDELGEALVERADAALYQAKDTGRNRVCCAAI